VQIPHGERPGLGFEVANPHLIFPAADLECEDVCLEQADASELSGRDTAGGGHGKEG